MALASDAAHGWFDVPLGERRGLGARGGGKEGAGGQGGRSGGGEPRKNLGGEEKEEAGGKERRKEHLKQCLK